MRINDILVEFAPSGDGGGSGDYFQALASAWYNGTFDSGSLQKGIKSQQDVEQLLQRGIIGPDGVTRKYAIDYNSTFDGVVISSDDYYEHADHDETDSRTGNPFGPYDYMEFGDEELDDSLKEGVRTESAELAKQYGWAYNQGEYGASMTHPKHGRISLSSPVTSRSGDTAVEREWTHNKASGIGDRSLAQHLQSLKEQGMAEGDLSEKSTSQSQFRTMAAAAHDPEFAKKVGIKQSVAREFNRADKDQDYKDLPKKATEGATVTTTPGSIEPGGAVDNFKQQMANNTERDMAEGNRKPEPPEADYGDDYQDMVKRVKKLAGLGPLKTQYDPNRRVYRNMPTAVQPKK